MIGSNKLINLRIFIILPLLTVSHAHPTQSNVILSEDKTFELRKFGEIMNKSLSFDVDPCEDLFAYVCTNRNSSLDMLSESVDAKDILQDILTPDARTEVEVKLQNYLKSCLHMHLDDSKEFVKNFSLPQVIGQWPVFDAKWTGDKFDLNGAIAELKRVDVNVVVDQGFHLNATTSGQYLRVNLEDFDLAMSDASVELLRKKLILAGVEKFDDVLNDVIHLEKEMKNVLQNDLTYSDSSSKMETDLAGLRKAIPEVDWDRQIEVVLDIKLTDTYPVVIKRGEALRKAFKALKTMNPKTVANYFFCKFVYSLPELSKPGEEECLSFAYWRFAPVLSRLYLKKHFTGNEAAQLRSIINYFAKILQTFSKFFGDIPLTEVNEKMDTLITGVYLSDSRDEHLRVMYENVTIDSQNFLFNIYALLPQVKKAFFEKTFLKNQSQIDSLQEMFLTIISYNLYMLHNKPSSLIYKNLVLENIINLAQSLDILGDGSADLRQCIDAQIAPSKMRYIEYQSFSLTQTSLVSYYQWSKENKDLVAAEDKVLQEYNLNNSKMLWLTLIQMGCNVQDENLKTRILSFIWNVDEFGEAFNCPLGSVMNPKNKCQVTNNAQINSNI